MQIKHREMNLDYLRIMACIMVIVLHVASQKWNVVDVQSVEWQTFNFYDVLVRSCVPLFFMISGMLFLSRPTLKPIPEIFKKNIWKMVVIYFVWALLYALDKIARDPKIILTFQNILTYIVNSKYHLWYLPALIGVYLTLPILWTVAKYEDGKYLGYACLMFFIFGILKTTLVDIPIVSKELNSILGRFSYALSGYSGYFLMGYYLNLNKDRLKKIKTKYILLVFVGLILFLTKINSMYAISMNKATVLLFNHSTLFVFIEAIIVFLLFLRIPNINLNRKFITLITTISKYTLFVYLFHVFVLEHLEVWLNITPLSFHPLASVPILSILIFVICICVAYILDHIPFVRKWIM